MELINKIVFANSDYINIEVLEKQLSTLNEIIKNQDKFFNKQIYIKVHYQNKVVKETFYISTYSNNIKIKSLELFESDDYTNIFVSTNQVDLIYNFDNIENVSLIETYLISK